MDATVTTIVLGCVGGLVPDLVRFAKDRHRVYQTVKTPDYLLGLAAQVVLGGLAAWLAGAAGKNAIVAGYAAPELISSLLAKQKPVPQPPPGSGPLGGAPPAGAWDRIRLWFGVR